MNNKPPILVVAGPTASGKTALGIALAKLYNGEVVSADSMQIYKGLDIATAKPTIDEMDGIPHHLIGFLGRNQNFSVAEYVKLAYQKFDDIHSRGRLPIVVGGTGLYITSMMDNIQFVEIETNQDIRDRLQLEAQTYGKAYLLNKLYDIDVQTAKTLHENNMGRIIRALEVYELTGKTMTELKVESRSIETPYRWLPFGINFEDRSILYDRINKRVDTMVQNGLIEECLNVYNQGDMKTSNQAIGYKELVPYFENKATLTECLDIIKQETRHYAKRQLTWFRKDNRINWIMADNFDTIHKFTDFCEKVIAKQNFL
ncbi:MAG: tRNA (adenosine(37)-N6)-dimethylallyltransferase MiaA [Ruminococcus sp.]|nr:tRNA (adenosine(37)-N6)-dimethylallyltransferase MiaA [Ruminococcus sp.]MCD7800019.1 tRNA (adenosine(37)-N6)-dimethylallyltransferase MiaA [Ruminococcus sp.]